MTIDAAAHKKQYELRPPEKEVRRMEIRAEQLHEHLTEEAENFCTDKVCFCYFL
jgi:hypothetical protein